MELDATTADAIRTKLQTIQAAFTPTDEQPVCDTFYITATYNRENPDFPINGDTAQYLLAAVGDANAGA
jgi:hypothetical protein